MTIPLMASICLTLAQAPTTPTIQGGGEYPPHGLVKLAVANIPPKAGVMWRVSPSKGVQRADTTRDRCQFAATPGVYEVSCLLITSTTDAPDIQELTATVTVLSPVPPAVPVPPAPVPPVVPKTGGTLDPSRAICRLASSVGGCSACPVGPQRGDGRWDVLTASHCLGKVGDAVSLTLQDGRKVGARVVAINRVADVAWVVTDERDDMMPFANLASQTPRAGSAVWQKGYGQTTPGKRKDGTIQGDENVDGKLPYRILVDHGDSGGPIFDAATDTILSPVCCSAHPGAPTSVFGGSWRIARSERPKMTSDINSAEWVPMTMPAPSPSK